MKNAAISPFKLLRPYEQDDDTASFFGRNAEARKLAEALRQSKFLLLYGASGTGKTSLIQCGLQDMLSPLDWMPLFVRRGREGFPEAIRRALADQYKKCYAMLSPNAQPRDDIDSLDLREMIKALFDISYIPVYLILDQFEEIFTLGNEPEQRAFFNVLEELRLFEDDLFCKVLLVSREEFIAHFYTYERTLPFLFEQRFRLEKMRGEQVQTVIQGMLNTDYAGYLPFEQEARISEKIAEKIVDKYGETDLATLQVYMDRLFQEDTKRIGPGESRAVRFDLSLTDQIDIQTVLSDFLDQQLETVNETLRERYPASYKYGRNIALAVLSALVTDFKTRLNADAATCFQKLNERKDLLVTLPLTEDILTFLALGEARIVSLLPSLKTGISVFELSHDRLAEQVFDKSGPEAQLYLRAKSTLENKWKLYQQSEGANHHEYLSLRELDLIDETINLDQLENRELPVFYAVSRKHHQKLNNRKKWVTAGVVIAALVFGMVAVTAVYNWKSKKIQQLYTEGFREEKTNPTKGFELVLKALHLNRDDEIVKKGAYDIFRNNLFYDTLDIQDDLSGSRRITFSENGELFAAAAGGVLKLYRTGTAELLDSYWLTGASISSIIFKGNDTLFAGAGINMYIFSGLSKSRPSIGSFNNELQSNGKIEQICFSKNGRWLCGTHLNNFTPSLWDLKTGLLEKTLDNPVFANVTVAAFSPESDWLALGGINNLLLYSMPDKIFLSFNNQPPITAIAFSPNGNEIVAGCNDGGILRWRKNENITVNPSRNDFIKKVKNSAETRFVFEKQIFKLGSKIKSLAYTSDGLLLITPESGAAFFYSESSPFQPLFRLSVGNASFLSAMVTNDMQSIYTVNNDYKIRHWDFASPFPYVADTTVANNCYIRFTPDGKKLIMEGVYNPFTVKVLDAGAHYKTIKEYHDTISGSHTLAVSNSSMAFADQKGSVYLWHFEDTNRDTVQRYLLGSTAVTCLALDEKGLYLLASANDRLFMVNPVTQQSGLLLKTNHRITAIEVLEDGNFVVGSDDNCIRIYNARLQVQHLYRLPIMPGRIQRLKEKNAFAVISDTEGAGYLYSPDTGLSEKFSNQNIKCISADGATWISWKTGGNQDAITPEGMVLQHFLCNDQCNDLCLSPDARQLAAVNYHGKLLIWKVRKDAVFNAER